MSEKWRLGPKRWDWLRSIRCALTGHRWESSGPRSMQRVCYRCWTVDDTAAVERAAREADLAEHFKECDCHDSWDQCPCADAGHPADGSCDCCPRGTGLCGPRKASA